MAQSPTDPSPPAVLDALLAGATERLSAAGLGLGRREARLEARVLAAHGLGVAPTWLVAHGCDPLPPEQAAALLALIERRARGEPVAYIVGRREFYGRGFRVGPDVLIPRPETEHLIEVALARLPNTNTNTDTDPDTNPDPVRALDIGTGSGCLAVTLALERPAWAVTAVDVSRAALAVAMDNGARLGARVAWLESDLYSALAGQRFDLIVSNPPYIAADDAHLARGDPRFEPPGALASGPDGLDALRAIVGEAPAHLEPGGWLLLEHGFGQAGEVRRLLAGAGLAEVFTERDLAGLDRISGGRLAPRATD